MAWEHDAESDSEGHSEIWEKAADDFDRDMGQEYFEEQVQEAIDGRSADSTRTYLGTYGDAVTARVQQAIADARTLLESGQPGTAITLAATAVELIVGYLVVRPIVQGAFLSDRWAGVLTEQVLGGKTDEARRLLPIIAKAWGLDLDKVLLPDRTPAWDYFKGSVIPARNAFVHRADPVKPEAATRAIECARVLLETLVVAVGRSVGMDWPAKPWQQSYGFETFKPRDPFAKESG